MEPQPHKPENFHAQHKRYMRNRPPEVVLLHKLEGKLEAIVNRFRAIEKVCSKKCARKTTVKSAEGFFSRQYKEVTDLLTEMVGKEEG